MTSYKILGQKSSKTFHLVLVRAVARNSRVALYNQNLVSMDKHGEFQPQDATGFINIHAVRLREFQRFKTQLADGHI
jgi:argininosuccinate synthase